MRPVARATVMLVMRHWLLMAALGCSATACADLVGASFDRSARPSVAGESGILEPHEEEVSDAGVSPESAARDAARDSARADVTSSDRAADSAVAADAPSVDDAGSCAQTCTGCCEGEVCHDGKASDFCGKSGAQCAQCEDSLEYCSGGACRPYFGTCNRNPSTQNVFISCAELCQQVGHSCVAGCVEGTYAGGHVASCPPSGGSIHILSGDEVSSCGATELIPPNEGMFCCCG